MTVSCEVTGNEKTHTHRQGGHEKTGAETGEMQPQDKEPQGPPAAERGKGGFFARASTRGVLCRRLYFGLPASRILRE